MFHRSSSDARFQRAAIRPIVIGAVLILLMVPEIGQHLTGYTLAVPFGAMLVFAVALAAALTAYILMILFVWRRSRLAGGVGFGLLAIPVGYLLWHLMDFFMLGVLLFTRETTTPAASGRLTPTATYRVVQYGLSESPPYTLEVYRNPRRFPFLRKRIYIESLSCGEKVLNADPKSLWIHASSDERMMIVECRNPAAGAAPEQIVLQ